MIAAFIVALLNPIEMIGTKLIFSKEKVNWKAFLVLNTVLMFFVTIFSFPFWGETNHEKISLFIISIFILDIIIAVIYNSLFSYALSGERVADIEPIIMTHPLSSMLFAIIIFPSERNWTIVILGLIAAFTLVISRIEKHHLKINKYIFAIIMSVLLIGLESSLVKFMTEVVDPLMLYTIRIGVLSIALSLLLRPNLKKIGKKRIKSISFVSIIIAIEMLLTFYAISSVGVVKTSLIVLLGPVLVLLGSKFYLGDTIKFKAAIADTVIVLCILSAILLST